MTGPTATPKIGAFSRYLLSSSLFLLELLSGSAIKLPSPSYLRLLSNRVYVVSIVDESVLRGAFIKSKTKFA